METTLRTAHSLGTTLRTEDVLTEDTTSRTFADLMLPANLVQGLQHAGFLHPSPIQWVSIPLATKVGMDLLIQSKSGTGKTLVYVLTAMNMIDPTRNSLQALALVPTREIAVQAAKLANEIASVACPDMKTQTFIGGLPISQDEARLRKCHFAIGTPGRIQHLITEKYMDANFVRFVALDEADELIGSKMQVSVVWIFNQLPKTKQVITLSATYPPAVAKLVEKFMIMPKHVRLGKECQVLKGAAQYVLWVPDHPNWKELYRHKVNALLLVLSNVSFSQCLVFSNSIIRCDWLCNQLRANGWPTHSISSDHTQTDRLKVLGELTEFHCRVLVSTDLTARGVDAQNVNLVINLDVPHDPETYLHRMGRAGRFGSYGITVSIASDGEEYDRLRRFSFVTKSEIFVLNNPKVKLKDMPDLKKIQKIMNGEAAETEDFVEFQLLKPLEKSDSNMESKEEKSKIKSSSKIQKVKTYKDVEYDKSTHDDLSKKMDDLQIETNPEAEMESSSNFDKTAKDYVKEFFKRKMEAIIQSQKFQSKSKEETSDETYSDHVDQEDCVEIEVEDSELDREDGVVNDDPMFNTQPFETEEEDTSCNIEVDPIEELDPDFVINHYARISGYTPFRMDKEADDVVLNYLNSRFEEIVSTKKDIKITIEEFNEKGLLYASSGDLPTDFICSNPKKQRSTLSNLENERLCQAIDFIYNESLENWSRDVSETYNKLKYVKDSDIGSVIQNIMEGREIEVEIENLSEEVCEEESITDLYSTDEVVPASYTGCVDDYLKKGNELHQFKENKKKDKDKKKLKPKEESLHGNLLPEPVLESDYFTLPPDGFNISEPSEKDDQTYDPNDDRLSQYGLSLHSDDEQICESRSVSLDLLEGPGIQAFPYPLNNPDEFMKPYLIPKTTNSWRNSYSSWKERVDANAKIIEETVFANLMRQHTNQSTN